MIDCTQTLTIANRRLYDLTFATTARDRATKIPRRRRNLDDFSSSSISVTSEPNTLFDNHRFTSITHMEQQPTPAQWQEMQRQLEQQQTELENYRRMNAPKPIGAIFNSNITTLPSCLVVPPVPNGVNFQVPHGLIANLPKFSGYPHENAIAHVKAILELCLT